MKKSFIFLIISICFGFSIYSQSLERTMVSSAGGYGTVNSIHFDWTLGETVIETINNSELVLCEGFHQYEGEKIPMHRIEGDVLADGVPYNQARIYLYLASSGEQYPAISTSNVQNGKFKFSFIPAENYILFAKPDVIDEYLGTYYVQTTLRNEAYVLEADMNIGGLDIHLVPSSTSVDEVSEDIADEISLYPNPVMNNLFISFKSKDAEKITIKITSVTGEIQLTRREVYSGHDVVLNIESLPAGSYVVQVQNKSNVYNEVIVKN